MGRVTGGVSGKSDFSKRVSTGICTIETFDGTPPGGSDPISIPDGIDDLPRGQDLMCERVPVVLVPKEIGVAHDDQVERQPQADELSCYGRIEIPLTLHVIEYHQQIEIATILGFVTRDGTEYYYHPRVGGIHDPADGLVHLGVIEQSGSSYVDRCDITHHRIGHPFGSCGCGTTCRMSRDFGWNEMIRWPWNQERASMNSSISYIESHSGCHLMAGRFRKSNTPYSSNIRIVSFGGMLWQRLYSSTQWTLNLIVSDWLTDAPAIRDHLPVRPRTTGTVDGR